MKYVFAIVSILLGAVAQFLLKVGMGNLADRQTLIDKVFAAAASPHVWGGLLCYGLSMVFWLYVLSVMELSRAYPMVSLGYVVAILMGHYFLGEPITPCRVAAVLLIMCGVCLLMKS